MEPAASADGMPRNLVDLGAIMETPRLAELVSRSARRFGLSLPFRLALVHIQGTAKCFPRRDRQHGGLATSKFSSEERVSYCYVALACRLIVPVGILTPDGDPGVDC